MKQAPPAALIEAAVAVVILDGSHDPSLAINRRAALKELHAAIGADRKKALKQTPDTRNEFQRGYLLGLETARQLLFTRPDAIQAGIEL